MGEDKMKADIFGKKLAPASLPCTGGNMTYTLLSPTSPERRLAKGHAQDTEPNTAAHPRFSDLHQELEGSFRL